MLRFMDSWEDAQFIAIVQGAAQKGAFWIVLLAYGSTKASLLAKPFYSRTRSSLVPEYTPSPFSIENDALCSAAVHGRYDQIRFLLKTGSDIDAPASLCQEIALNLAISRGHRDAAGLFLHGGADPDSQRSRGKRSPLHAGAKIRGGVDLEVAEIPMRAGANASLWNDDLLQPLHQAAINGHRMLINLLLGYGAQVDDRLLCPDGYTALMLASASCHVSTVDRLLAGGANINALRRFHGTALMLTARDDAAGKPSRCVKSTIEVLLEHGADVSLVPKTRYDKGCLLHKWLQVPHNGRFDDDHLCAIIQACLEAGADLNERNDAGRTPLEDIFFKCSMSQVLSIPSTISALLKAGCQDNALVAGCARLDWGSKPSLLRHILEWRGLPYCPEASLHELVCQCATSEDERRAALFILLDSARILGAYQIGAMLVSQYT